MVGPDGLFIAPERTANRAALGAKHSESTELGSFRATFHNESRAGVHFGTDSLSAFRRSLARNTLILGILIKMVRSANTLRRIWWGALLFAAFMPACGDDAGSSDAALDVAVGDSHMPDAPGEDASFDADTQDAPFDGDVADVAVDAPQGAGDAGDADAGESDAGGADASAEDAGREDADAERTCDPRGVVCLAPQPVCDDLHVPSVVGGCWGPCVPIDRCPCESPEECPDPDQYTCNRARGTCTPFL